MSIYRLNGVHGEIVTTALPSGDMAVSSPSNGPLEQIVFDVCRWDGKRNPSYEGWIVPHSKVGKIKAQQAEKCTLIRA